MFSVLKRHALTALLALLVLNGAVAAYTQGMLLLGVGTGPTSAAQLVTINARYGPDFKTNGAGLGAMLIDASGEKAAFIFRTPCASIDEVGFRLGTVTTWDDLTVSLQNVDTTTGAPDGTQDQSVTITGADTDDNTWKETSAMTNRTGMTIGDLVAVVIEFGTWVDGSLNVSWPNGIGQDNAAYPTLFTAAWAKQTGGAGISVTCTGVTPVNPYYPALVPILGWGSTQALNTGSTPDEAGLIFQRPFAFTLIGGCAAVDGDNPWDLVLYDSDGSSVLASASFDPDVRGQTNQQNGCALWAETAQLAANTNYRLVAKPTTASNIGLAYGTVNSAAYLNHVLGGANFHWTQRTDAGAWSQTTTQRPLIDLLIGRVQVP